MEEDRWQDLPAPVYARSFLSTYARYLGLDDEALVEEYRSGVEGAEEASHVPPTALQRGSAGDRAIRPLTLVLAALVTAALAVLVITVAVGGSDNGGDGGKRPSASRTTAPKATTTSSTTTATAAAATTTTTTTTATGSEVSVELRATADVWVCLVDATGDQLVNGETLTAGQDRGPFAGKSFELTLGNGSVEMTVDGEPVRVPALAEPLGYRVTRSGAQRLDPGSQPSCT
jgi:cytoskeletal protein RodZ